MAVQMQRVQFELHADLLYQPLDRRLRASLGGAEILDTLRPALVWEPRRIVPSYAVPVADLRAELVPAAAQHAPPEIPVLHPGIPFAVHSSPGDTFDVVAAGQTRPNAAFRPADADLDGYAVLDFRAPDEWLEEDEPVVGHPRDPFKRIDTRRTSREIRIEVDGEVLARSTRATLLFETGLYTRFYFPREDVLVELVESDRRTTCAYKGHATHWSVEAGGRQHPHLAWSYADPFPEVAAVRDLVAFYDERVDVFVDGEQRPSLEGPLAQAMRAEFGP